MKFITVIVISFILLIPVNAFALEINADSIDISKTNPFELEISGTVENYQEGERFLLTLTHPDKSQTIHDIRISDNMPFLKIFTITDEWNPGEYAIDANYGDVNVGNVYFIIEKPFDPRDENKIQSDEKHLEKTIDDNNDSNHTSIVNCELGTESVNGVCKVITDELVLAYRVTHIDNFPDPLKTPQQYIDRYNNEKQYKKWFDSQFPNQHIENIVKYKPTDIEGFPDNEKSPKYYLKRYLTEDEYSSWIHKNVGVNWVITFLGLNSQQVAHVANIIGNEITDEEDYENELKAYHYAIHYDPTQSKYFTNAGWTQIDLDNLHNAEQNFNRAISINATDANGYFGLADVKYYSGMLNQAITLYKQGLEIDPNDEFSYSLMGLTMIELGNDEGLEYVIKALNMKHDDVDLRYNYALALDNLGKYNDAINEYEKVLKIQPDASDALNNIGYIHERLGDYEKAKKYYNFALNADPSNNYASSNLEALPNIEKDLERKKIEQDISEFYSLTMALDRSLSWGPSEDKVSKEIAIKVIESYENNIRQLLPASERKQFDADIEFYKKDLGIGKSSKGGGCLIATATYGSEMATEVQQLRELRDNSLLNSRSGVQFMSTFNHIYYSFSPVIADYERENPYFKEAVKIAITPLISSLSILNYVDMDSEAEVLGYGISLIVLILGMYLGVPVIVIVGIKKKF